MSVSAAVDRLSAAFAARDVAAALACFVSGDHIGYAGSELDESATGPPAVTALLTALFARDEAYSWTTRTTFVHVYGSSAYLFAEVDALVTTDAGELIPFPYRISGLAEVVGGNWLWRHCQGCEPTTGDGVSAG